MQKFSDAEIATAAYHIWQAEGCPQGRDRDHWHQACEALKAQAGEMAPAAVETPKPKAKRAAKPKTATAKAATAKAATTKPRAKATRSTKAAKPRKATVKA